MSHTSIYVWIPILLVAISACEQRAEPPPTPPQAKPQTNTQSPLQSQAQLQSNSDPQRAAEAQSVTTQSMPNPKAVIVVWAGPSDRPTPPTIFWADKAALESATEWIAKRGQAPIGVTAVETRPDDLPCIAKVIPSGSGRSLLEVFAWEGASASAPSQLDAAKSKEFLTAAIGCVGDGSSAAGYLKSLQTLVNNASH